MNAICPRCGTVSLVGQHDTRFTCRTCHLPFCPECRYWKEERKQTYCARCGATFSEPPSVMPYRIMYIMFFASFGAAILVTAFGRPHPWQTAMVAILPSVIYTTVYLFVFNVRTGLAQATWREAIFFVRRTMLLATLAYIGMLPSRSVTISLSIGMIVVLLIFGLAARRLNASAIEELQAHRPTWQAILSVPHRNLLLLRFPDLRAAK